MSSLDLPGNIAFLPKAYREYKTFEARDPEFFKDLQEALVSLGENGPPKETRPFVGDDLPHGLAYWFPLGDHMVVFEPGSRLVLQGEGGARTIRSVLIGGKEPLYTIWIITSLP